MNKIKKAILLPDIHFPHHSIACMHLIEKFMADYKPDVIVYMGDQLELEAVSFFNKNTPSSQMLNLSKEYNKFNRLILKRHEKICPKAERVWMIGNHEYRITQYLKDEPKFVGLIEPEIVLNLRERGYKIIQMNKIYRLGKLRVIHGYYWNMYHAKKTVDAFEGSVCYAHVHNPQMHAKINPVDTTNYHIATALPCLCTRSPEWKRNAPNHWIHGFGICEIFPNRDFNLYPIIIHKKKFSFNGKIYD
jgi:predicted phosphodiesterase